MELVPIKVKITRKPVGNRVQNDYPAFNEIDEKIREGVDWCHFVDQYGGWHYDRKCGFGEVDQQDETDPHNNVDPKCIYGCLLVPKQFAMEALRLFPDRVSELTEDVFKRFYEERAFFGVPDEIVNRDVLDGIAAKKNAGIKLNDTDRSALDPDSPVPGINRNNRKHWDWYKAKKGIKVISSK